MSRVLQLAEIADNLQQVLHSLDMAGLPLTAALIDLAVNQVEDEISKTDAIPAELAPFGDPRFALLDRWALRIFN